MELAHVERWSVTCSTLSSLLFLPFSCALFFFCSPTTRQKESCILARLFACTACFSSSTTLPLNCKCPTPIDSPTQPPVRSRFPPSAADPW